MQQLKWIIANLDKSHKLNVEWKGKLQNKEKKKKSSVQYNLCEISLKYYVWICTRVEKLWKAHENHTEEWSL